MQPAAFDPAAGDTGAGKTYPSGYDGPDLYHYMYVSSRTATGENAPPAASGITTVIGLDG